MPRLDGKIALITGGASGIGATAAALFARESAVVYATDRAAAPREPLPAGVEYLVQDVTDEARWQAVVGEIFDRHGKLDVLVNNAGVLGEESIVENTTTEGWRHTLEINVSSIWGNVASAAVAPYQVSKGAIRQLTKNGAVTYAKENIRVNSIHPGLITTPMVENFGETNKVTISMTPMGRPGRPEEIAYGMLYLASDEASYMTGGELVIDGAYTAQ